MWQEHESLLRTGVPDYLKPDAALLGRFRGLLSRVAPIHIRKFHAVACHLLHSLGQLAHLYAVLLGGRSHMQREQVPQRVHGGVHLRSLLALGPVVAHTPLSGVERSVRLSNTAAVG